MFSRSQTIFSGICMSPDLCLHLVTGLGVRSQSTKLLHCRCTMRGMRAFEVYWLGAAWNGVSMLSSCFWGKRGRVKIANAKHYQRMCFQKRKKRKVSKKWKWRQGNRKMRGWAAGTLSFMASGNTKWYFVSHCGRHSVFPYKTKHIPIITSSSHAPWCLTKWVETYVHTKPWAQIVTAALFIIAKMY